MKLCSKLVHNFSEVLLVLYLVNQYVHFTMSKFENLKLKNQLCFALYAATNAITLSYRTRLNHIGLTYPQYLVMMVLWQADGLTVKSLAEQLHLDSATITPLLKRLEAMGFVHRRRNLSDERVVNIFLSDKGRAIEADVAAVQTVVACQTGLPDDDFVELRSTLHQLVETINKSDGV